MYTMIAKNKRQTIILFIIITAVLSLIGFSLGYIIDWYPLGLIFLGIVGLITLIVYSSSTSSIVKLTHGVEANPDITQQKQLINIVENLSITAGIPAPKIYVTPDTSLNAFAAGTKPEKSIVGVTQGLLDHLSPNELEAVIGHEISHIQNYDTRVNVTAYAIGVAILLIGEILLRSRGNKNPLPLIGLLIIIVGYPAVFLTRLAISRQREYLADISSIKLTRNPEGMANALEKLKTGGEPKLPSTMSHMFLNTGSHENWFTRIMSTHPPLDDRIRRARASFDSM